MASSWAFVNIRTRNAAERGYLIFVIAALWHLTAMAFWAVWETIGNDNVAGEYLSGRI